MPVYSTSADTAYGTICACGTILSLVLNPLLLLQHLKKEKSLTNNLFIHLCIADFATGLIGESQSFLLFRTLFICYELQ